MRVDERAPAAVRDLPVPGDGHTDPHRVRRLPDDTGQLYGQEDRPEQRQDGGRDGDSGPRDRDEDDGGGEPDPERPDDERVRVRREDAPDEERAGQPGRPEQGQKEPQTSGLQGPPAASEPLRRVSSEPEPADRHDDRPDHGEADQGQEQLATQVGPGHGHDRGHRDDQLAVPERRRIAVLAGLGEAGEDDAGPGERGQECVRGLDRHPPEQQVHTDRDRDVPPQRVRPRRLLLATYYIEMPADAEHAGQGHGLLAVGRTIGAWVEYQVTAEMHDTGTWAGWSRYRGPTVDLKPPAGDQRVYRGDSPF